MQLKKLILRYKKYLPVIILGFFSFFINFYYGFIGVMPMDNFVLYNGGYRILNGYIPFTDYWLVTGPLLDYLNALFFYFNGVNWTSYIIHSSTFNTIISLASYLLFVNLGLEKKFSLFYSILFSILFYPIVGTPFVDHHSTLFLLLAFYLFIFGVNKNKYIYFTFIPFFFSLSFLSKQTPATYGLFAISFLIIFFLIINKKKRLDFFLQLGLGSILTILFLFLFFYFTKIDIINFYDQYILFAKTIGEFRFSKYNFNLIQVIYNYKFLSILIGFLLIMLIRLILRKNNNSNDIFIILTAIILASLLIFHQIYTLNQNYIFFLIPFLTSIIHIFYKKIFKNKIILFFLILICVYSTTKYHLRFNEQRKFNELEKVDLSKAINAEILTEDLKGLKWITYKYPNDPMDEIVNLKEVMAILSKDVSNKALITDYQFLAPALKIYDFSPNQWHHPSVSFPLKDDMYYKKYQKFFFNSLKKNNIKFLYETSENENFIIEMVISKDCLIKEKMTKILTRFELVKGCQGF